MGEKHLDTSTLTAASSKIDVFGIVLPSEELIKMDGRPIIMHEWSPLLKGGGYATNYQLHVLM